MKFLIIHDEFHKLLENIEFHLIQNGHQVHRFELRHLQLRNGSVSSLETYDAIFFDRPEERSPQFLEQIIMLEASNTDDRILNSPIPYSIFRNKATGTAWLINHGFAIPETLVTKSLEDALDFAREHKNIMCKPLYGHSGQGIFGFNDGNPPIEKLESYLETNSHLYLQQFITTNPVHDLRVEMIREEIIYSFLRIGPNDENYPRCNIALGASYKLVDIDEELKAELRRFMKASKLTVAGIDLIWSEERKKYLFLEVNPEPTQSEWQPKLSKKIAQVMIERGKQRRSHDSN